MNKKVIYCLSFSLLFCGCLKHTAENTSPTKTSIRQITKETGYKTVVYFDISSSRLSMLSQDELMRAARLQAISQTTAYLTGHADKTGIKEKNMLLSKQRVTAVKDYLLSLGVKEDNVYIEYVGDEKPLAEGDDIESYAKNRCVVVVLSADAGTSAAAISENTVVQQRDNSLRKISAATK